MDYFMKGCLIPWVVSGTELAYACLYMLLTVHRSQGMYPTAIILLVALNKSHFEGTTRGDIATPHMSFRRPTSSQDSSNSDEGSHSPCRRSVGGLGQPGLNAPWNSVESTVVIQRSVDGRVEESTNAEGKRNYAILPISHPIPTRPHSVS